MKKTLIPLIALLFATTNSEARNLRQEFAANPEKAAGVYYVYQTDLVQPTPKAPTGYEPFYISHYGRHGSRTLLNQSQYDQLADIMFAADRAGVLTEKGKEIFSIVRRAYDSGLDEAGDLTPLGAEQHRGIALRMVDNYPEIFKEGAVIDARATEVPRCIVSMASFIAAVKEKKPAVTVNMASGNKTVRIINFFNKVRGDTIAAEYREYMVNGPWKATIDSLTAAHIYPRRIADLLFNDIDYAKAVDKNALIDGLFRYARGMQNMCPDNNALLNLFTNDELYWLSVLDNYKYYATRGASRMNKRYPQYYATKLVRDLVSRADAAVAGKGNDADLRFGHDGDIMAFLPLLGLNNYDVDLTDPEEIAEQWPVFEFSPMASNLQIVFYRKPGNDTVLVNIRMNEQTAKLPLKEVAQGFYKWSDVRTFFNERIDTVKNNFQ